MLARVDEREVEPVADAEPVEARPRERLRLRAIGRRMDVEDAAALGMRERAHAVLAPRGARAPPSMAPLPRRITSGISSGSETSASAPARSGVRTSPTAAGGSPAASSAGRSTSSTSAVTVRSAAPPVRRTTVLPLFRTCAATSSGDVRPRLEVRADRRRSARAARETRGRSSSATTRTSRSSGGERGRLPRADAAIASTRASSSRSRSSDARVEAALAGGDVARVGGEHVARAARARARGRRAAPPRRRRPRRRRAPLAQRSPRSATRAAHIVVVVMRWRRFTLYCFVTGRAHARSASREAEGTGPMTPRQPASTGQGAKPAERGSDDVERDERRSPCPPPHLRCTPAAAPRRPLEAASASARAASAPLEPVYDLDASARR